MFYKQYRHFIFIIYLYITVLAPVAKTDEVIKQQEEKILLSAQRDSLKEKMSSGESALCNKKYFLAFKSYQEVIDASNTIPVEPSMLQEALYALNQAAVLLILKKISLYKYHEAKKIALFITSKKYFLNDPSKQFLVKKIANLSEKKEPNKDHHQLEKIEIILSQAIDFYYQHKWELAKNSFHETLKADPNNDAAELGLSLIEKQENIEIDHHLDNTQRRMMDSIHQSWELPNINVNDNYPMNNIQETASITAHITEKIHDIKIPHIEFINTPLQSALEQIKDQAFLLDKEENDFNKKGINIVLAFEIKKLHPEPKINLNLHDIPLIDILRYVAQQAKLQIRIEPYAIAIVSADESPEILITKEYKVSSNFILQFPHLSNTTYEEPDNSRFKSSEPRTIKDVLLSQGIAFPPGATAHFMPSNNILIVKNSITNLNLVAAFIENLFVTPLKQVEIEARFLEVKQNISNDRGVNWLLEAFKFGCHINARNDTSDSLASTQQIESAMNKSNLSSDILNKESLTSHSASIVNSMTEPGISAHALETLLFGNPAGSALGILSLAGVLSNTQFQFILRAMNQHKGVNLLSAPKVTVSNGKKATIRIAREFPYPSDYAPPQIPQNQGTSVNPAIPTTPSAFKKRNVGVELEVEPIINPSNNNIELSLSPQIVEFQGFVNYGNPIFSQAPSFLAGQTNMVASTTHILLTENNINQPVFSVREVDTEVVLHDGQTVVLGGLMREDIKQVEEKIPILGNIPLAGALFRSSSEQKMKRNLLIFVTVHLLDPSGKRSDQVIKNISQSLTAKKVDIIKMATKP